MVSVGEEGRGGRSEGGGRGEGRRKGGREGGKEGESGERGKELVHACVCCG